MARETSAPPGRPGDFDAPDILVNNAAVVLSAGIDHVTFDAWGPTFAVNVDWAFLTPKAVLPDLKRSGSGHVINITSWSVRTAVDVDVENTARAADTADTHGAPASAPTRRRQRSPATCSPPPERPGPSAA